MFLPRNSLRLISPSLTRVVSWLHANPTNGPSTKSNESRPHCNRSTNRSKPLSVLRPVPSVQRCPSFLTVLSCNPNFSFSAILTPSQSISWSIRQALAGRTPKSVVGQEWQAQGTQDKVAWCVRLLQVPRCVRLLHGVSDICITVRAANHHWSCVVNATTRSAEDPVWSDSEHHEKF